MYFQIDETGILPVECRYIREGVTTVFWILEKREAAIVDASVSGATPHILAALEKEGLGAEDVKYIIITHVHLDHSAGTAALLRACPHAQVLCHPKAALHLANPERLVKGAKMAYGEEAFEKLYGRVEGVDKSKIRPVEDGEKISFGSREFTFLHTRGHANHHICLYDSGSGALFAGDTFGLAYPRLQIGTRPLIYPNTAPIDFDPVEARKSIDRIEALRPSRICLAHYGVWKDVAEGARQLRYGLEQLEKMYDHARSTEMESDERAALCKKEFTTFLHGEIASRGIELSEEEWLDLEFDILLNSSGIAVAAQRNLI